MRKLFTYIYLALIIVATSSCDDDVAVYYGRVTLHKTGLFIDINDDNAPRTMSTSFTVYNVATLYIDDDDSDALPEGWECEIDFYAGIITVTATDTAIEIAKNAVGTSDDPGDGRIESILFEGETHDGYSVSASLTVGITDFVYLDSRGDDMQANSMIVNEPGKFYIFNPTYKGEESQGVSVTGIIDDCELLWRSNASTIRHTQMVSDTELGFFINYDVGDFDDDEDYDELVPGNAVVAAINSSDDVLWSWHIWIAPEEPQEVTFNNKTFMDRNLGAYMNTISSIYDDTDDILYSYGLYYQWGRKDPFIQPIDYQTSAEYDGLMWDKDSSLIEIEYEETTSSIGTMDYARENPLTFITGVNTSSYDWLYSSHDNSLWADSQKSIYDPSPKGWRVPRSGDFAGVSVASSPTNTYVYGANLLGSDSSIEDFMACGYRTYLVGGIQNINSNFAPWCGYYWTSGAESTSNKAYSMIFSNAALSFYGSSEEILTSYPLYRANGMQIRCVKDE